MGAAYFYHLTSQTLEQCLTLLLGKAREAGWRIEVRGADHDRMVALDTALWQGSEEGFLPHGLSGGAHDALQPILLSVGESGANNPDCVMSVDGASVSPDEVVAKERVCIIFDGQNGDAVQTARNQWKSLTDAGCAAQYWAQTSGRWEKKAETAPT